MTLASASAAADDHPGWFAQDYRSPSEWGFYCEGSGKSETEALQSARANCSQKICLLFGVEVDAKTVSSESLKDASVTSTVVERCPSVRVVGRTEKHKSVDCDGGACAGYVYQVYPKTEYDAEYKRLNQPAISKVFEKTIIIREGDETFRDPKACRTLIDSYSNITGDSEKSSNQRVGLLTQATNECKGLDYRDTRLASELTQKIWKPLASRDISTSVTLSRDLANVSTIEDRVRLLLEFERNKLGSGAKLQELRGLVGQYFDSFSTHIEYDSKAKGFRLADGSTATQSPYITETHTCMASTRLVENWPANVTGDVTVCSTRDSSNCVKLNSVMLRAQWSACVCRSQAAGRESDCTREFMSALQDACPGTIDRACMKNTDPRMAERLGSPLAWPSASEAGEAERKVSSQPGGGHK
jgi:hypothetical protein